MALNFTLTNCFLTWFWNISLDLHPLVRGDSGRSLWREVVGIPEVVVLGGRRRRGRSRRAQRRRLMLRSAFEDQRMFCVNFSHSSQVGRPAFPPSCLIVF